MNSFIRADPRNVRLVLRMNGAGGINSAVFVVNALHGTARGHSAGFSQINMWPQSDVLLCIIQRD